MASGGHPANGMNNEKLASVCQPLGLADGRDELVRAAASEMNATPGLHCNSWGSASATQRLRFVL